MSDEPKMKRMTRVRWEARRGIGPEFGCGPSGAAPFFVKEVYPFDHLSARNEDPLKWWMTVSKNTDAQPLAVSRASVLICSRCS
jgi:hypothetical protein